MEDRDSRRWLVVKSRARNPKPDFCYGVITTRIYCRPTCPGRVARRANIVYFDDALAAQASGYRACKRCSPELDEWERDARGLNIAYRAQAIIAQLRISRPVWTVDEVATQLCISATHLHRIFKKHVGLTPKEFAQAQPNSWQNAISGDDCTFSVSQSTLSKLPGSASAPDTLNAEYLLASAAPTLDMHLINQVEVPWTPLITHMPACSPLSNHSLDWEDWLVFDDDVNAGGGSEAEQHATPGYGPDK